MELKMTTAEYYDEFSELWGREYGPLMQTALFAKEPKDFAHVVMGRGIILPGHSVLDNKHTLTGEVPGNRSASSTPNNPPASYASR